MTPLAGVAVLALALLGCAQAAAQTAGDPGSYLMNPRLDGSPRTAPRFRQPAQIGQIGQVAQAADDSPGIGQLPTFGLPPASGAGSTGFNSTNVPRKKTKAGQPVPPLATGQPALLPPAPSAPVALPPVAPPPPAIVVGRPPRRGAPALITGTLADPSTPYPLPVRRRPATIDDDPYAQLGWRAGAFLVLPAVEFTTGYDTNPSRVTGGGGAAVYTVAPELIAHSDWERHALDAELRGSYTTYGASQAFDRPNFNGKIDGRLDVSYATKIDMEGRLIASTDNPGSPNIQAGLAKLPIYTDTGFTAGVTHTFNRLELSAKGSVDRTVYQDSLFTDGEIGSNHDRDVNEYGAKLRASYETLPGVKPFVELDLDQRVHDLQFDRFGFQRDSAGTTGRIGTTVVLPARLTGEISAGYTRRNYKDPSLESLSGFIFDSSLIWSATALTKVTFTAKSATNEIVLPGVSGYLARDYGIQLDHSFRRWLIGTVRVGTGNDSYVGSDRVDQRYSVSAALVYKFTRTLSFKGEIRSDRLTSSEAGHDYTANAFLVGLRLQR